jgi:hypothetical protein
MTQAIFKRPDGGILLVMAALVFAAALAGLVLGVAMAWSGDFATSGLALAGCAGACALGAGLVNGWRTPMLEIKADALVIPTAFGKREIPIRKGHPLGEYLASSHRRTSSAGTIEGNKFVHFFTLDNAGQLTELVAMHREAPVIADIRRALRDITGLEIETLTVDPNRPSRPDIAHWRRP